MALEDRRLAMLEEGIEKINARLALGTQTFSNTNERFAELHKKLDNGNKLGVMVVPASLLLFVGGLIWQAASYPNREEFEKLKTQVQQIQLKQTEASSEISAVRASQKRTEIEVAKIGDKLDVVLVDVAKSRDRRR